MAVYFLQLFPYVAATGDLADWRALSHPECIYCASVATGVEEIFAAGNHSAGGLVSISSVVSAEIDPGRWWSVDVELVESPSVTVDGAGNVVEEFPDTKTYRMTLAVVYETEHWVVRELSHELVG